MSEHKYKDKNYIPIPKYKEGQVVYIVNFQWKKVEQKLIRKISQPIWNEYNLDPSNSHWEISYRYQDYFRGKPSGKMHTMYTLVEEEIYETEEAATIALANQFIDYIKHEANNISENFRRLGIPMNETIKLLN